MKKYLYYPYLEPPNTEWLKFAILYLDSFESIVPHQRQDLISDDYRKLSTETDLVTMYSPEYHQGERASLRAIDEAEKYLLKPYQRSRLFNKFNLQREWRDERHWNYLIFSEKFSYQFSEYVIDKGIGERSVDGLRLPKELAFLFMTYLAKEISYERNGSIITDDNEYDNYTNYERVLNPRVRSRHKFLKGLMNLLLPTNINEIKIDRLIEFRNTNRELIKAFNRQVDLVEDSIGDGTTEKQFIDSFTNAYSELARQILLLGIGVATIPFATYILVNNPLSLTAEYAKETLGALGIGFGGAFALKTALYDSRDRRMCKKYLTNVERLK